MTESRETTEDKQRRNERVMREGKVRFLEELENKLQAIQELLDSAETGCAAGLPDQVYRYVHTLKGSAPVFGFGSVGAVAESLAKEWEWSQDEAAIGAAAASMASRSARNSRASLMQLKMELDILQRRLRQTDCKEQGLTLADPAPSGKLLIIDDDDVLRSFLVKRFELDGYTVRESVSVERAKSMLREELYDLVLLDLMMYPQTGYELFHFLKEDPTLKWVPLIVLSARSDVDDKVRCLMLGANDYVTKPFQYEELAARVYSLLSRTKNFEQLAFRDPLTGVSNRRYFDHQIEQELQRIARYPAPLSIAFIDIDRFKTINDSYGHAIGDLVLQGLAHLLQQRLRTGDLLARFGGEEFVVVMPGTTGEQAVKLMTGTLEAARRQPIVEYEGQSFSITFSGGVAEWRPGMRTAEWIALADGAMYRAKEQGRNRVLMAGSQAEWEAGAASEDVSKRKRVLVADDDGILRSILVARLKQIPVDVLEAADGEEAYRLMTNHTVDLCILDGVMPKLDGFELLRRMRREPDGKLHGSRVLMLSGKKREDVISQALRLGADEYMSKPFSLVELEMRVKRLLLLDA